MRGNSANGRRGSGPIWSGTVAAGNETIGERVQRLLDEREPGKPRRQICQEAGVSYKTLNDLLVGHTRPRYRTVSRLAEYLGVSAAYLFSGEETDDEQVRERLRALERQVEDLLEAVERLRQTKPNGR